MAQNSGLVSLHKDKTLGISVTVERSHQYTRGNKATPETGYAVSSYVSIPLSDDKRPIDEILKDPKVIDQIMLELQKRLLDQTKERDAFVQD